MEIERSIVLTVSMSYVLEEQTELGRECERVLTARLGHNQARSVGCARFGRRRDGAG